MYTVTRYKIIQLRAKDTVFAGRNMMEFVNGYQAVIKRFDPQLFDCKAEGGMGANKNLIATI
jgi:hypothetical protein